MVAGKPKVLIGADAVAFDLVVRVLGSAYQRPFAAVAKRLTGSVRKLPGAVKEPVGTSV